MTLEALWRAFRHEFSEDDWMKFVNLGGTVAERLRRFDWLMARHQQEESSWEARP